MNSKHSITTTIFAATATLCLTVMPCCLQAADSQMEWRLEHPLADFSPGSGHSGSPGAQDYFFVGGGAGVALMQDLTLKDTGGAKMTFDPGARFDVSLGYQFAKAWSYDFENGFIYNSVDR